MNEIELKLTAEDFAVVWRCLQEQQAKAVYPTMRRISDQVEAQETAHKIAAQMAAIQKSALPPNAASVPAP